MRRQFIFVLTAALAVLSGPGTARADTTITFTRAEVNEMSMLWETDCVSVSPLPNAQYPAIAGTWDFIFPHSNISADADIHIDMAIDSSGTGSSGNNTGNSPIVCEVINATSSQLNHLDGLVAARASFRGIFRLYTEHPAERHFELHPVTQLQTWNGSTFVTDTDYHNNIVADPNGTTHPTSTLTSLLDGSQTITATMAADNINVTLRCPSPSVNYVQYDGITLTAVQSDALGQYFLFQPSLVPGVTVRCRLIGNTAAASAAAGLVTNQSITVNALTRTDMAAVSSQIATMNAGQQKTFMRPVEFVVLGLLNIGPAPTPTPTATTFANSANISITSGPSGATPASPYPSTIAINGLIGAISKVTVSLTGLNTSSQAFPADFDILLSGPSGQNTMLMSDAGGSGRLSNVNLTFDDAAASQLSSAQITSGTYRPTNLNPSGDNDAFPSPAPAKPFGSTLSLFNGTSPNGTWNLFVLDEYTRGTGSIANGWSIAISTVPAAPLVTTNAATGVSSTTATMNGSINPLGQMSSYEFQFGADTTYPLVQQSQFAGSGMAAVSVNVTLAGLQPGTTYHYRLTGLNNVGVANGADKTFTTAALVDSDGDGMPNDYETAHGFNPNNAADAALDSDGDGMTNLQEYLAGTDPRSAASVLRITSIQNIAGDIVITFPSTFGKTYRIEQKNEFTGAWFTLQDNIRGSGGAISFTDTEASSSFVRRFYRVVLIP